MKKFREVYTELGIHKSTAQKWVNEILCKSIFCKEQFQNDSNEWEFTDEEISKIWEVAFYRELDYSYKEIIVLLKSSQIDIQKIINQKFDTTKKRAYLNAPSSYIIIKEEDYFALLSHASLIAFAIATNSSLESCNFGLENNISDSFWIGIRWMCA